MEKRFGIIEFLSPEGVGARLTGRIKTVPEDFCVNEISTNGAIIRPTEPIIDHELLKERVNRVPVLEELVSLGISEGDAETILDMGEKKEPKQLVLSKEYTKEERSSIHVFFKAIYSGKLVTDCPEPNRLRISCRFSANRETTRPYDRRNESNEMIPKYLYFIVEKRNMDTMEVISIMSKGMRGSRQPRDFSFAGTKDRRAVTVQMVAVRGVAVQRLLGLNGLTSGDGDRWFRISGVKTANSPIGLGDLRGNHFAIIVRLDTPDKDIIMRRFERLLHNGFINYFGMQRFGTHSNSTDMIGEALMKEDFKHAIDLIMTGRFGDVKEAYCDGDYALALERAPPFLHTERAILQHLCKSPNDLVGAIMAIPRETRMLYVHAWQSRMWNFAASDRMSKSGNAICPGDLVLVDSIPVVVDESNISDYSIHDVVIPLLGYDVMLPSSFKYHEPDFEPSFIPINKSLWDLPGAYRHVVVRPSDCSISVIGGSMLCKLSFSLPPSSYATIALRDLFIIGNND